MFDRRLTNLSSEELEELALLKALTAELGLPVHEFTTEFVVSGELLEFGEVPPGFVQMQQSRSTADLDWQMAEWRKEYPGAYVTVMADWRKREEPKLFASHPDGRYRRWGWLFRAPRVLK